MSSAFYPLGMNSYNNRIPQGGFKTWKGNGVYQNPIGVVSTNIRPLTNNDYGNVFPSKNGLPRPIKHYRKGTVSKMNYDTIEDSIKYNLERNVKSSVGTSLGGGSGGLGMVTQVIDNPSSTTIKDNVSNDSICNTCDGIKIVSDWYPIQNLTEKPEYNVTNPLLCCNQQRKAKQRVLGTNTNVKKNYFQSSYMYLYNRCQTFQQREFNFSNSPNSSKPGDPTSMHNQYVAQCNPNFTIQQGLELNFIDFVAKTLFDVNSIEYQNLIQSENIRVFFNSLKQYVNEQLYNSIVFDFESVSREMASNVKGCSRVYYKPNNPQFANQGAVSSSTRILKLNVDTITQNAYKLPSNLSKNKVSNTGDKCIQESVTNILKSYKQLGIK